MCKTVGWTMIEGVMNDHRNKIIKREINNKREIKAKGIQRTPLEWYYCHCLNNIVEKVEVMTENRREIEQGNTSEVSTLWN